MSRSLFSAALAAVSIFACQSGLARAQAPGRDPQIDAIMQRLEQQEAEIRSLREQLQPRSPQGPLNDQQPHPYYPALSFAPAGYASIPAEGQDSKQGEDWQSRFEEIEKRFDELQAAETKREEPDDGKPKVGLRGRIHTDAAWFDQSEANRAAVGDMENGTYFRRARLGMDVKAFDVTEYRLDFEMGAAGRPSIFDAYGRVTELPILGNVQLGHFREPFSLEAQTSSNWFTFIERGLPNVFDPSRNWGLMTFDHSEDESITWAVGVFREGSDEFGSDIGDSGERAGTARVTWLPYYDEPTEGRYLLHLGGSYSYRRPDNEAVRYAERPEVRIQEQPNPLAAATGVPVFVDTGTINADEVQLACLEASWVNGPLCIQSEYIGSSVDSIGGDSYWFHGAYIYASYFLTGESRQYNRELGTFDRQEVFEPFFRVGTDHGICTGSGAWELTARWSYLDLNDDTVAGSYLDDTTFGVNWYLHPYMRLMFNYIHADLNDPAFGESDANIFLTRLDVHW